MGGRKKQKRKLKGSIYIVGEGITEQYYFAHLKQLRKYQCTVKPRFFGKTSIPEIERTVKDLLLGGVCVICVFDADVAARDKAEQERLQKFRQKYAGKKNVLLCDSMPAIEFWFLLHYLSTTRHFLNTGEVIAELKKYLPAYCKEEKYLANPAWVTELCSDDKLLSAIIRAKDNLAEKENQETSSYFPYSRVFEAFDWLEMSKKQEGCD